MLRGIRALVDFFGDHLAEPGLFCEPFARGTSYRMPAQLDSTGFLADADLTRGDDAWSPAESQLVLESELGLENIVLARWMWSASALVVCAVGGCCCAGLQEVSQQVGGGLWVILRLRLLRVRHWGPRAKSKRHCEPCTKGGFSSKHHEYRLP